MLYPQSTLSSMTVMWIKRILDSLCTEQSAYSEDLQLKLQDYANTNIFPKSARFYRVNPNKISLSPALKNLYLR